MNTLTIDETIAATQFICRVHRLSDGALVGEVITTASSCDLPSLSSEPVYVVVIPYQGLPYQFNHSYAVDDLVLPLDTISTPFYFKRLVSGTSGNIEPTWATLAGAVCDDNGISGAWLAIDLAQPVIQSPVTLTAASWDNGLIWDDGLSIWDTQISNWME
jgi:hypothetical protein